jgi:hypothetical protein
MTFSVLIAPCLVNYELGLPMPVLTTPLNYVGGGESNG